MELVLKLIIQWLLLPFLQAFVGKQVTAMKENGEETKAAELARSEIAADVTKIKTAATAEEALDALTEMAHRARARRKSYGL
jgi:hypothetical protein